MTTHQSYQKIGLMISADMARRLDNACWRASASATVSRGEFISYALRKAVEASERGEPFQTSNEGTNDV